LKINYIWGVREQKRSSNTANLRHRNFLKGLRKGMNRSLAIISLSSGMFLASSTASRKCGFCLIYEAVTAMEHVT
jgi:hypothetical protein